MDLSNFRLWTAIVTPFSESGKIDWHAYEGLLRRQESAGNGVVLLGSTGEGLALDEDERREVIRFSAKLQLRIPLMAGVGGAQLPACEQWLDFCGENGISAFLAPVPLYAKPGTKGQIAWFQALLERSTKPFMFYNVPSRTGVKLGVAALEAIASHPHAWAVKEASGSVNEFLEYRAVAPKLRFFSGDDGMTPSLCAAGGVGLVSVASNVWPEATKLFVDLSCRGDVEGIFPAWKSSTDALFLASNPVPVKALLAAKGLIPSAMVRPPLSAADLSSTAALVSADRSIQSWFEQARSER